MTTVTSQIMLLIFLFSLIQAHDVNTFSNYWEVPIKKLHLEWLLDLDDRFINATAQYQFKVEKDQLTEIHLDIYQLAVDVVYLDSGRTLKFGIQDMGEQSLIQGDRLKIILDKSYTKGSLINLRIRYSVTTRARALSFMSKEQTQSKVLPYLYSYCQDNNCRSMIPLQDTPSIKQLLSAVVLVKDPRIKVFMTGNLLTRSEEKFALLGSYSQELTQYHFQLDIPIPSYLIAIVAGNLQEQKVGDLQKSRSYVICEPTFMQDVLQDLEDLQLYVDMLADYIGPYEWGDYKIVIMPPSFPLGGMEHPLLTFASPTIITGDKTGVGTAIHEIAHSWVGNTVTCKDWANMWINEGFCTFLERYGVGKLNGEEYAKVDSFLGNLSAYNSMLDYGLNSTFSSLHPNTENKNPDDSVSNVPYDKGYQLLKYIEQQMGEEQFKKMLRQYIIHFKWQSIDEDDFYKFLLDWVTQNLNAKDAVRVSNEIQLIYKEWVYVGGLPPRQLDFHTTEYDAAIKLGNDWVILKGDAAPENANDFNKWKYNQKAIMLSQLSARFNEMTEKTFDLLETTYKFSELRDSRLQYRWFIVCLQGKYYTQEAQIKNFMGTHGAKSWLVRMYTTLKADRPRDAKSWFEEFKWFYHPSVVDILEQLFEDKAIMD